MKAGLDTSSVCTNTTSDSCCRVGNCDATVLVANTRRRGTTLEEDDNTSGGVDSSSYQLQQQQQQQQQCTIRTWGRLAGLCYMGVMACTLTAELLVWSKQIDLTNANQTAANIAAAPFLFRWGMLLDAATSCFDVMLSIFLGLLLIQCGGNPIASWISVAFRLLQQAVFAMNLLNLVAVALLLDDSTSQLTSAFVIDSTLAVNGAAKTTNSTSDTTSSSPPVVDTATAALAYFFLTMHQYGSLLALLFLGVSLVWLGMISVWQGALFPPFLGGFITVAGCAYLADSLLYLIYMGQYHGQLTNTLMLPVYLAELLMTGYLCLFTPNQIVKL